MEAIVEQTIKNLVKNNIAGYFVENKKELISLLEDLVPGGVTVGCGDSVTLEQMGVFDYIRAKACTFYDKYEKGLTSEDKHKIYIKNFSAHTFLTGTNAIVAEGKLFNIDGNGSRIAPMIYGPQQVIVVVGTNKIVRTLDEAIYRARQIAAPMDAKRLKKNTPCTKTDRCMDCAHEERICNDFVLITGEFKKDRIKVIFVNQSLGF